MIKIDENSTRDDLKTVTFNEAFWLNLSFSIRRSGQDSLYFKGIFDCAESKSPVSTSLEANVSHLVLGTDLGLDMVFLV